MKALRDATRSLDWRSGWPLSLEVRLRPDPADMLPTCRIVLTMGKISIGRDRHDACPPNQIASKANCRSSIRSRTPSTPTLNRTRESLMPSCSRISFGTEACVMMAG